MPLTMDARGLFLCGIVEGFYGRQWPHERRLDYARLLASAGLNCYVFCPKGDPFLRRRWREDWPATQWRQLEELAAACARHGVAFGPGLSPYELYLDYGAAQRAALRTKVERLEALGAPLLAVLFDDMPGDVPDLAQRQADIVADVCAWLPGVRVLVCPTYYSFDPALETHFGARPPRYWRSLGRALPAEVDVFWTGNEVCSGAISARDVRAIRDELGRSVLLWDNYPVNDGATRSQHLYTRPLPDRDRALRDLLSGHLCNPMNQPCLSLPALSGLAALYGRGIGEETLARWLGEAAWERLKRDGTLFEEQGLEGLGPARCAALADEYARLPGEAAREVAAWLRGEYRFDPACLTD